MIKDVKPRGMGKTYDMVKLSAETGYPILVINRAGKTEIYSIATHLGIENRIPNPVTYEEYIRMTFGAKPGHIIIDNAEYFLKKMFALSEIYAISMSETPMYTKEDIAAMIGKAPSEFEIVNSDGM